MKTIRRFLCVAALASALGASAAPAWNESIAELSLEGGRRVQARIRVPAGAKGRLPAVMIFGGFEGAPKVLDAFSTDAPVILASFDYPYEGSRKLRFVETLRNARTLRSMTRDTAPLILELVRALRARADVDPERIVLLGASFGTPFAVYAAAASPDVRYLVLLHGFADAQGTARARLARWLEKHDRLWPPLRGPAASFLAWAGWSLLGLPEVEDEARKLRPGQNALVIEASGDRMIPPPSRAALRESLRASGARVDVVEMESGHLRGVEDRLLEKIVPEIARWLTETGALPAKR